MHSLTCHGRQAAGMGLATGKMYTLSRADGAAGSSAFDLAKMAASRFVICYPVAVSPSESGGLPAARWLASCRMLAGGAAADLGAAEFTEGGRGSGAVRERSYLIHYAEKKIFTLPNEL